MKRSTPARYKKGRLVYVRGWPDLATARVTDVLMVNGWPYYEVLACEDASVWLIPRLHLFTKPFALLHR
jgi:hypothetical protein